jgi:methyl-accepting chemotaxis protein
MAMEKVNEIANKTMQMILENFRIFEEGVDVSRSYAATMANGGKKVY